MLAPKKTNPKKVAILTILMVVILAVIIYVIADNFNSIEKSPIPGEWSQMFSMMSDVTLPPVPDLKTDASYLEDPKYVNLQPFPGLPVKAGTMGRENPFTAIEFNNATSSEEAGAGQGCTAEPPNCPSSGNNGTENQVITEIIRGK